LTSQSPRYQHEQLGQHIGEKPGDGHTKTQPDGRGVSTGPTAKAIPKLHIFPPLMRSNADLSALGSTLHAKPLPMKASLSKKAGSHWPLDER